jgi:streptogramin lyase
MPSYWGTPIAGQPSATWERIAGTGIAGLGFAAPFGFPATLSSLDYAEGAAVDAHGNVYIADSANNVIRRMDAKTGVITTVAGDVAAAKATDGLGGFSGDGGPATSAQLNDPQGVAVDGAGDLFIADTHNSKIAEVTNLAQSGSAAGPTTPAS